jgi:hypothetical protein
MRRSVRIENSSTLARILDKKEQSTDHAISTIPKRTTPSRATEMGLKQHAGSDPATIGSSDSLVRALLRELKTRLAELYR